MLRHTRLDVVATLRARRCRATYDAMFSPFAAAAVSMLISIFAYVDFIISL